MSWLTEVLRNLAGLTSWGRDPSNSPNGASSFHLTWEMTDPLVQDSRLREVSAVLEVRVPPSVRSLYFWALQVDFADAEGIWGGAHTGLQWNQRYPDSTAVNWGGYASAARGGAVLSGTVSSLPGFADDPNTLSYHWVPERPYRLRVYPSPETTGAWRAEVTDVLSGATSVIRDLLPPPDRPTSVYYLTRPVVWSEVFADCDAPSVAVRWSELEAVDETGAVVRPEAVHVNYQAPEAGGCPNTTVAFDGVGGFFQVTNTPRLVMRGDRLPVLGGSPPS